MSTVEEPRPRINPLLALGVAIAAVSTSAILIRWSAAPNLVKAFYRVLFTTALIAPLAVHRSRADIAALSRRDLLAAIVTGVALAVHFAAWFESLEWTSVAASVTLVQAQPLFVAAGAALLLGERISRGILVGIAIAIAGMVLMTVPEASLAGQRPAYGNALALVGAIMAAAYVLAGRSLRQRIDLIPYVAVVYAACAGVLLLFVLADGAALGPRAYPSREWALFLAMAIGPGILGHTLINWALRHLESSVVSVSLLGEPVGSTALAVVLLGEIPGVPTLVGGTAVLLGIGIAVRARR